MTAVIKVCMERSLLLPASPGGRTGEALSRSFNDLEEDYSEPLHTPRNYSEWDEDEE